MVLNLRCRTCLCEEIETVPLENYIIIEGYNANICLLDVIKECASVEIPLGDSRPQGICKACLKNAKISYSFRRKCEQSQIVLAQEYLTINEIKLESDRDVSSDDDIPLSKIIATESIRWPILDKSYKTPKTYQTHKPLIKEEDPNDIKDEFDDIDKLQDQHVCIICSKSFTVRKYYLAHIQRHADKSFKEIVFGQKNSSEDFDENTDDSKVTQAFERACKKCETILHSHREWKEHMKTHRFKSSGGKSRKCPECLSTFPSQILWLAHVRTAHTSYTCRQCNITSLRNIRELKTHMARIHSDTALRTELIQCTDLEQRLCGICGRTYVTREAMFKHKRQKHGNGEQDGQVDEHGVSYCDYCSWKGTSAALAKHKMAEHAHLRSIECSECKKMFFTNHNLRLHMLVHTGVKKHMCEVCGCSFALQSNLIIHKRVHTGEKPYKCDQCDKAFTQHSSLTIHKFTHTDKPTFSCDQCGATFYRKDSFRYHMKKHRSEDEWEKCEICDKKFKSRKLLKNHRVVHTGERNHQCSVCGKSFGRRSSLKTHQSIHTGEKPHVCLVCGRGFLQKHVLRTHLKTHRNK